MKEIIHWIKYVVLLLFVLFFIPIGIEQLIEPETETMNVSVIENNAGFNRMYTVQKGADLHTFYKLSDSESKIRAVYDAYGIQLYFVTYEMDYNNLHETVNDAIKEVTAWLQSSEYWDENGLYYVVAEYDVPSYGTPEYDKNVHYWETELQGYVIYGDNVNTWWTTSIQEQFETLSAKYDYRLGSYNDYENFINVMYELSTVYKAYNTAEGVSVGRIIVFILFSILPLGIATIILYKDVKRYRKKKQQEQAAKDAAEAEETRRILSTPIKTLQEEEAEELLDKYNTDEYEQITLKEVKHHD